MQVICLLCCLAACRKQEGAGPLLPEGNRWILDSMRVYYYWKDALPARPASNADARAFFKSLLHAEDRFSWLADPDHPLEEYSSFAYYGLEYALVEAPGYTAGLLGVITLVVPGGAADGQGLRRGDCFTAVDGRALSTATAEEAHAALRRGKGVRLQLAKLENGRLQSGREVTLSPSHFTEQPVYLKKIFDINGARTGYLFYNYFDGRFDQQLLDSLYALKKAGIGSLVLDLRYNPGGDVASAALLAAVIAPVKAGQDFVVYEANGNGGRITRTFQQTLDESQYRRYTFEELQAYRLQLRRLVVLTTGSTASAAELLVNNLRPYMEVVQVGETTMGKDMGSFAISDQRQPKQVNYTLYPLVFKLYNAEGKGGYHNGLQPQQEANEFSALPLKPLGDTEDPLLAKALALTGARRATGAAQDVIAGRRGFTSAPRRGRLQPLVVKKPGNR